MDIYMLWIAMDEIKNGMKLDIEIDGAANTIPKIN